MLRNGISNAGGVHEAQHILSRTVAVHIGQRLVVLKGARVVPRMGEVAVEVHLGQQPQSVWVLFGSGILKEVDSARECGSERLCSGMGDEKVSLVGLIHEEKDKQVFGVVDGLGHESRRLAEACQATSRGTDLAERSESILDGRTLVVRQLGVFFGMVLLVSDIRRRVMMGAVLLIRDGVLAVDKGQDEA